ncbi:MAG: thiamine-phosphate kinase [Pseudomonadota bacterium]
MPTLKVGDDCAQLKAGQKYFLVSVDTFVENVHFDLKYFNLAEVGERCTEAAISDIAAMGGKPLYITLSLSASNTDVIEKIADGVKKPLCAHKMKLIGGDITYSKNIVVSLTVIGETKKPILRSGAKPGDYVYVSSYTGLSEAGRLLLKKKVPGFNLLKRAHKSPEAKIKLGLKLSNIATSMIDISDSLISELYHIAHASNVSIEVENIPIHKDLKLVCKKIKTTPERLAMYGGEDYALLYTVPPKYSRHALGHRIGKIILQKNQNKKVHLNKNGKTTLITPRGFKHF